MKHHRRTISLLTTMAMLISLLPTFSLTAAADTGSYEPATQNSDGVYEIANAGQLFWFASLVNGDTSQEGITAAVADADAILTTNIDLDGADWTPIGSSSTPFTGTFDGADYTVSGLYINNSSSYYQGLFGYVQADGNVQNVTVSGNVTAYRYVGIVGVNRGTVTNCCYSGTVSGNSCIGGVVGLNSGTVTNCNNNASVTGNSSTGGVVGQNESSGIVQSCINSGTVISDSSSHDYVGGIVGNNNGSVTYCLNSGTVSGNMNVGGLIGYNTNLLSNSYNIGTVSGNNNTGGVVGNNYYGSSVIGFTVSCYCLENTADAAVGVDSGRVTNVSVKTADEFSSGEVTYLLNDGTTDGTQAWYQTIGTDDYPVLDNTHGTVYYTTFCDGSSAFYSNVSVIHVGNYDANGFCDVCGAGYEPATLNTDGVYEITNAGQFYWFASLVNGDVTQDGITAADTSVSAILTTDIDLDGKEWTPIGTKAAPYTGTFDGNGYSISGLSITTEAEYIGLFGYVEGGTVKDLTVSGAIDVEGDTIFAGGVVGTIRNGVLSNLTSDVDVTGTTATKGTFGGVAATVEGTDKTAGSTMENCANYGDVTASGVLDCTGGLVGYMNSATINNCTNYGKVDTIGATAQQNEGVYAAGIVSYINNSTAVITNCINVGTITGANESEDYDRYTGAIVGRIKNNVGEITNVYYVNTSADVACAANASGVELDITAKTADELASGAVTYLLQNSASDSVWGQDLESDAYPTLYKTNVVKVAFINGDSTIERYANVGATLANYPTGSYAYFTDSDMTNRIDTNTYTYSSDTTVYMTAAVLEINSITISDGSVDVNITNTLDMSGVVLVAAYDADGALVDFAATELTGDTVSVSIDTTGTAIVSALIWDSASTMIPLRDKYSVTL